MLYAQTWIVLSTIMQHPTGLNRTDLVAKIQPKNDNDLTRQLLCLPDSWILTDILEQLSPSVSCKDGIYQFHPDSEHYHADNGLFDASIRHFLQKKSS
ncbi:MAG: hypothetical protein Q8L34_02420 [Candidatus Woesearchaeota archaeon]|nr:hypothetical protein [Candidatus Woesearchaeota archaeon]